MGNKREKKINKQRNEMGQEGMRRTVKREGACSFN